jgi:hypothetical protein
VALQKKPIKTDLFKFVTLRTPQLINEQKKDLGFIFHDNELKDTSNFLSSVTEETTVEAARQIVENELNKLTPLTSLSDVKAINLELYTFSSWLMNNRNALLKTEVDAKASAVSVALSNVKLNKLWDNLYYQVFTRKSSYIRQACIQLLIAQNFLNKKDAYAASTYKFDETDYLIRLANAKVVIDKAFTKEEQVKTASTTAYVNAEKQLKNNTKKYYFKKNLAIYKTALNEILNLEYKYTKANNDAYKTANDAHKLVVDNLIEQAELVRKPLQEAEDLLAFS